MTCEVIASSTRWPYDRVMISGFGRELRHWRNERGLSQLDLASRADVSQRHLSFLETGRSKPSREMVLHLGRTLDVPPREQNVMLAAAGLAPAFTETSLDDLPRIRGAIEFMLDAHAPNMAIVVDRHWDVVAANEPVGLLMGLLLPDPSVPVGGRQNVMRLTFAPDGLRTHMVGWERTAAVMLRRLLRDAAMYPHDERLRTLVDEILGYPGVSDLVEGRRTEPHDLLVTATYVVAGVEISLFTTITTIGDAQDLTLAELRLETFWPADEDSALAWAEVVTPASSRPR